MSRKLPRAFGDPTRKDIQKKFDELSFKHSLSEQWEEVKRKTLFVPPVITKEITSGEDPFVVTREVAFCSTCSVLCCSSCHLLSHTCDPYNAIPAMWHEAVGSAIPHSM